MQINLFEILFSILSHISALAQNKRTYWKTNSWPTNKYTNKSYYL